MTVSAATDDVTHRLPIFLLHTVGVNVAAFMWLRTIMCYQQAHGTKMREVRWKICSFPAPFALTT